MFDCAVCRYPDLVLFQKQIGVQMVEKQKYICLHGKTIPIIMPYTWYNGEEVTGRLKPYLLFHINTVQHLLEKGKALAVTGERPRGRDNITDIIDDSAIMFEFRNVDSYMVHGFSSLFQN